MRCSEVLSTVKQPDSLCLSAELMCQQTYVNLQSWRWNIESWHLHLTTLYWVFRLYLLLLDRCCKHPAMLLLLCLLLTSQTVLPHAPAYSSRQVCTRKDLSSLQ